MSSDQSIPILDFAQVDEPGNREAFLQSLLTALRNFGIFYVKNTPVDPSLFEAARAECYAFFALPTEKKAEIGIAKSASFLGYTALGTEMTANRADWREHLALSDSHPKPTSGQAYLNLLGPNQWPSSTLLPKFQSTMEEWLDQVSDLSNRFRSLVGEAMGIDPNHFDHFLHNHQHRLRLIRYPELLGDSSPSDEDAEIQSCGAHRDTVILTLIQQASPHSCLQVQSPSGQWTDCPPIDNTFVFVAGQSLEAMTHGVTMAPWHRVIPPRPGLGPRYSVILSSTIGLDTALSNKLIQDALERLKKDITPRFPDAKGSLEDFLCKRNGDGSEGTRLLNQLLRSHPDVAARWYPHHHQIVAQEVHGAAS